MKILEKKTDMDTETETYGQEHGMHVKGEWEEETYTQQEQNVDIKVEWEETDGQQEHRVLIEVEPAFTRGLNPRSEGIAKENALLDFYAGHKLEGDLVLSPGMLQKSDSPCLQPTRGSRDAGRGSGAPRSCPRPREPPRTHFKPYSCDVCAKQFTCKNNLDRHVESHARGKIHYCKVCTQQFYTKTKLIEHNRSHRGEKRYTCDTCMKQFALKASLVVHLLSHTREKPYSCGICKKKYKCKYNLVAHEQDHIRKTPYPCDECTKRFTCEKNLIKHKSSHVPKSDIGPLRKRSRRLAQHVQIHNENKPYGCKVCPKRYTCEENLNRHKLSHAHQFDKDSVQKTHRTLVLYI